MEASNQETVKCRSVELAVSNNLTFLFSLFFYFYSASEYACTEVFNKENGTRRQTANEGKSVASRPRVISLCSCCIYK